MKVAEKHDYLGFTIVELLVVILVIGILAAITIVSYTGITNKATIASIQTDLSNANKKNSAISSHKWHLSNKFIRCWNYCRFRDYNSFSI